MINHIISIYFLLCVRLEALTATILVRHLGRNESVAEFQDDEAQFGRRIVQGSPIMGRIYTSNPLEGCLDKIPLPKNASHYALPFVCIIKRGNCTFEEKVIAAERGGFVAAIVFNHISDDAFPMSSKTGFPVNIPAVMIGLSDGLIILERFVFPPDGYIIEIYANHRTDIEWYVIPVLSVLGLFVLGILCMCIFRWHDRRRRRLRRCLTSRQLKRLPSTKFIKGQTPEGNCVICLEDFENGDRLRTLPCQHVYHIRCIDPWLLKGRRVCPICKRPVFGRTRPSPSLLARLRFGLITPTQDAEDGAEDHLLSDSDSELEARPAITEPQPVAAGSYGTFQTMNDVHIPASYRLTEATPLLDTDSSEKPFRTCGSSAASIYSAPGFALNGDHQMSISTEFTSFISSLPCSPNPQRKASKKTIESSSADEPQHSDAAATRFSSSTQSLKGSSSTQSPRSLLTTGSKIAHDLGRRRSTASHVEEVTVVVHRSHSPDNADA